MKENLSIVIFFTVSTESMINFQLISMQFCKMFLFLLYQGFTPFSLAVSEKRMQKAEFLKDKGANVDALAEPNRYSSFYLQSQCCSEGNNCLNQKYEMIGRLV